MNAFTCVDMIPRTYMEKCEFQGYTPLHLATQFGHESIYKLLKDVYGKYRSYRSFGL